MSHTLDALIEEATYQWPEIRTLHKIRNKKNDKFK